MEILDFSDSNLAKVLSNQYSSESIIEKKDHFRYLKEYLGSSGLSAKKIIVEEKYVSRDYLHDYTSYYAYCFEDYKKYCTRVHFFGEVFTKEEIMDAITSPNNTTRTIEIWESYLGFIVVKPIPITVIGFTILKTYPNGTNFGSRNFWGIREYKVHFFGKELKINSLAFQEQDSVVAACATTAIWAMLNKASTDHYTILKSPIHITKDADNVSSDGSRLFPNNGLNILQISQAIYNSGLVSEVKKPDKIIKDSKNNVSRVVSNTYLKKIVNAYSPVGIPIILIINVPNGDRYGLHAVTVSGYKKQAPVVIQPNKEISYLSENIEKLYAHDDQWGPFVRISFTNQIELELPWSQFHPKKSPTYTTSVVVPLYPKIRISYEDIDVITLGLDAILTLFFGKALIADLVWDIKLYFSEDFKSTIHSVKSLNKAEKEKLLTQSLPKYIWVVSCYISDYKIFDFTFDATDVKHGMIGLHVLCYLPVVIRTQLNSFLSLNQPKLEMLFRHRASSIYYQFLINQTK